MLQDRRQYQRVIPDQPVLVRCGESQCRLLIDLSEEGLAIDDLGSESSAEVIPLVFDLPNHHGHIQAKAKIAWSNASEKRAGLRFLDLPDISRQRLRQWISASVFHTTELALAEEGPGQPPIFLTDRTNSIEFLAPQPIYSGGLSRYGASHYLTWLVLGAVSLFSGIAFVRHYLGMKNRWQGKVTMAAGKVPEIPVPSSTPSVEPPPAPTPFLPVTHPLSLPGFVLQVAAMKHEDNADALAKTLQEKNFPAFVFKRGANPFYRVAVGAYSDPDSAHRVKDELKAQGFESILKHWSPA